MVLHLLEALVNSYITLKENKLALDGIVHINPDGEFAFNDTYNVCNSDDIVFLILRSKRNELLQQSDWMAVADRTMTQAQIDYRQALRDLPETADPQLDENGNLTNVTWPSL